MPSSLWSSLLLGGERSRCASCSGDGRLCDIMFLQYSENVEVPQIPSSTECYRFQLYYTGVYVQCTLCKRRRFHSAVTGQVVHAPVVMLRQVPVLVQTVQNSSRNCGGSAVTVHRQFGSRACCHATTGANGPDCAAWS